MHIFDYFVFQFCMYGITGFYQLFCDRCILLHNRTFLQVEYVGLFCSVCRSMQEKHKIQWLSGMCKGGVPPCRCSSLYAHPPKGVWCGMLYPVFYATSLGFFTFSRMYLHMEISTIKQFFWISIPFISIFFWKMSEWPFVVYEHQLKEAEQFTQLSCCSDVRKRGFWRHSVVVLLQCASIHFELLLVCFSGWSWSLWFSFCIPGLCRSISRWWRHVVVYSYRYGSAMWG